MKKSILSLLLVCLLLSCSESGSESSGGSDEIFSSFGLGINISTLEFASTSGGTVYFPVVRLINGTYDTEYTRQIENADSVISEFSKIHSDYGLENCTYGKLWVVKNWKESWFESHLDQYATFMDNGGVLVIMYWYFGDTIVGIDDLESYMETQKSSYYESSQRLAALVNSLEVESGKVMVVVEPELNTKEAVYEWSGFTDYLIENAIGPVRDGVTNKNIDLYFGTAVTDCGALDENTADDEYGIKAKGDSSAWPRMVPLLKQFGDSLDFVAFQGSYSQFNRNSTTPSSIEAQGLNYLHQRILNLGSYLHGELDLPVMVSSLLIPTGTWSDSDGDSTVDLSEVDFLGWEDELSDVWVNIRDSYGAYEDAGIFALCVHSLFDIPDNDLGGYQYLSKNEYALGFCYTDAERDSYTDLTSNISYKKGADNDQNYLETVFTGMGR